MAFINTSERNVMSEIAVHQAGLPATGFVRLSQLVNDRKHPDRAAILPFSSATLWRKVKTKNFPSPIKLSERITAWRVEDVRAWMESMAAAA